MKQLDKARILVFAGSTRADSLNRRLAREATSVLRQAGADAQFADLADYPMPLYDGDLEQTEGIPARAKAFKELVREHDAVVIAAPEYNGSFPALVKNTIDWITRPEAGETHTAVLRGKNAAVLSASPGPGGGQRGLRHLRELLENIGVNVIPTQVAVGRALDAFNADGKLVRSQDLERVERMAGDLISATTPARPSQDKSGTANASAA